MVDKALARLTLIRCSPMANERIAIDQKVHLPIVIHSLPRKMALMITRTESTWSKFNRKSTMLMTTRHQKIKAIEIKGDSVSMLRENVINQST